MGECLNRHYVRTKFRPNPRGQVFFCVDLTWNDPFFNSYFVSSVRLWNSLPNEVALRNNISSFKSNVSISLLKLLLAPYNVIPAFFL